MDFEQVNKVNLYKQKGRSAYLSIQTVIGVFMLSLCPVHGNINFSIDKKTGVYICKRCHSAKLKKQNRARLKEKALLYKGGKCSKCGYSGCIGALEFHHTNPQSKDFNISKNALAKPWEVVVKELDKCILLCANCHRELHSGERL